MNSPFLFRFGFVPPSSPSPTLPADVIQFLRQVDAEIVALNDEMTSAYNNGSVTFSDDFVAQRKAFYDDWKAFSANYLSYGWGSTWPSTAWDQVGVYESKNEAWRTKFIALGGKPIDPGPQARPEGADVAGAMKWGAAAVIAGAVAYGVYEFVGKRRAA